MLFISHANPEDNEFARWLSLRLAAEGYPVWCDLTQFLGGEDFWTDAELAIRTKTIKFIYVLSRTSNTKAGPRAELQVARNVERDAHLTDFVIPLRIDDLPPRESNILIAQTNSIACHNRWAEGFSQLLAKLEKDGVGRSDAFGPKSVQDWWRKAFDSAEGVRPEVDTLVSNWYPISSLPPLRYHELSRSTPGAIEIPGQLPYPGVLHNQYLLSFADAECFAGCLGRATAIIATSDRTIGEPSSPGRPRILPEREERDRLTDLLRQSWASFLTTRGVPTYLFANNAAAFYFRDGFAPDNRVSFQLTDGGRKSHRQMVGFKTIAKATDGPAQLRYWHFGVQAKPMIWPVMAYVLKSHVLFSDDGQTIWPSKENLHRARRSQCKNWWNADWRDRQLAAATWLSESSPSIRLQVGRSEFVEVSAGPLLIDVPVSYTEIRSEEQSENVDNQSDGELLDDGDDDLEGDSYEAGTDL